MSQDGPSKWQKALEHWNKWGLSVNQTKALIQNKYGEVSQIYEPSAEQHYFSDSNFFNDNLKPEAKETVLMFWDLINEVEKIGGNFISKEMGLSFDSPYHLPFLDYWKYSIYPELRPSYGEKIELVSEDKIKIWTDSQICTRFGKEEIIDSISWVRGSVNNQELLRRLFFPFWPDYKTIQAKSEVGRHSDRDRIDMESIVFSLLKEQGMLHKEMASIFQDEDRKNNLILRTIYNRVRRGKELRDLPKENITDK